MKVYIVIESICGRSSVKGVFDSSEKARAQVRRIIGDALRYAPEAEVEDLPAGKRIHSRGLSVTHQEWTVT